MSRGFPAGLPPWAHLQAHTSGGRHDWRTSQGIHNRKTGVGCGESAAGYSSKPLCDLKAWPVQFILAGKIVLRARTGRLVSSREPMLYSPRHTLATPMRCHLNGSTKIE